MLDPKVQICEISDELPPNTMEGKMKKLKIEEIWFLFADLKEIKSRLPDV